MSDKNQGMGSVVSSVMRSVGGRTSGKRKSSQSLPGRTVPEGDASGRDMYNPAKSQNKKRQKGGRATTVMGEQAKLG